MKPVGQQQKRNYFQSAPVVAVDDGAAQYWNFDGDNLLFKQSNHHIKKCGKSVEPDKRLTEKQGGAFIAKVTHEKRLPGHSEHLDKQEHKHRQFVTGAVDTHKIFGCGFDAV